MPSESAWTKVLNVWGVLQICLQVLVGVWALLNNYSGSSVVLLALCVFALSFFALKGSNGLAKASVLAVSLVSTLLLIHIALGTFNFLRGVPSKAAASQFADASYRMISAAKPNSSMRVEIWLFDPKSQTLVPYSFRGEGLTEDFGTKRLDVSPRDTAKEDTSSFKSRCGLAGYVFLSGNNVFSNDIAGDMDKGAEWAYRYIEGKLADRSMIAIKFESNGTLGVFCLSSIGINAFDIRDREIAESQAKLFLALR